MRELEFVSVLGQGGFGSVTLMRDSNFNLYAEKSCSCDHLKNLLKELRIMLHFRNHPRIVQALNPLLHLGIRPERCFIYMEYASKGTLDNIISQFLGKPMPEEMVGSVARMIIQGLVALHSHGYVHCDLKPANILVFPSKTLGELYDLKLADFGISKEPCTDPKLVCPGTKFYMPPESAGPDGVMGPEADIWSLGCVVLEMFGGVPKEMGDCYMWSLPGPVSPMVNCFLRRCLALQPSCRATAVELLNHPFVTQRETERIVCPSNLQGSNMRGRLLMMLLNPKREEDLIC